MRPSSAAAALTALALIATAAHIATTPGAQNAAPATNPAGILLLIGRPGNTPPGAVPTSAADLAVVAGCPLPHSIPALPQTFARNTITTTPAAWHALLATFARNAITAMPPTRH